VTLAIRGIDLSQHHGDLTDEHWLFLAAHGVRFAYLRAGFGNREPDTHFSAYAAGAGAARIAIGACHFALPLPSGTVQTGLEPEDQAQAHYEACEGLGSSQHDLPPAMDLQFPEPERWNEWGCSAGQVTDWTIRYVLKASALYGRIPVIRSYSWWIRSAGLVGLGSCHLWLDGSLPVPSPWSKLAIQQISASGCRLPNDAKCDEIAIVDPGFMPTIDPPDGPPSGLREK
jgi:GH25 family lysozyme M1 (1,4-beta-N-acetylmuramidase)